MLGWGSILRLGLVQTALGAVIVLMTATLNRVMVVELAFPAILAGGLFAAYYATQFLRPHFGHGTDRGGRRTPWIVGGVAMLAAGAMAAAGSVALMSTAPALGIAAAVPAFLVIGLGIGAAGTNLLALLAEFVAPERKAAAGSAVWILMVAGLASTGIAVGAYLDTYSFARLVQITAIICAAAMALTLAGVWGIEGRARARTLPRPPADTRLGPALRAVWADPVARRFAVFVFAAMFAYNAQDLILEPFAGHVFDLSVADSTRLGATLHQGALMGMLAVLALTGWLRAWVHIPTRALIVGGCLASGAALLALGAGAQHPDAWPLSANIFALGVSNGVFAVAAIGAMMGLASEGGGRQEGVRMGVFGAAQAIAFGAGAVCGTAAVDIARALTASDATAYGAVFTLEGGLFLISALIATTIAVPERPAPQPTLVPGE